MAAVSKGLVTYIRRLDYRILLQCRHTIIADANLLK